MNRAKKLKIDPLAKMVSDKTFSKRHKLPVHVGILDYMQLFMDPGYKPYKVVENYTLDYVSRLCLNTTKLKHPYKNMLEFQKDVPLFTMYNVIDNLLVKLIDDKHGMLDVAFSLANVAQIEVNKIQAPVHITEVLMCREFLNKNLRMLKKPWNSGNNQKDETYEGAYVMHPTPGYYDFVACYDFKSMYPNIQMQFNISPDAYIGKIGKARETGREIRTKNETLFSNKEDSVTRTILNRLYNARVRAQNDIKNLIYKNE
jgi:DNA polymerase elongation subunit (family B)